MRIIIFVFLFTFFNVVNGQANKPFSELKFDKVIMYDFEGGKDLGLYIIDDKGQLPKSVTKLVQLDKPEIEKLNSRLGIKQSYGGATAFCFDPHLGFVYYLNEKIVGHVTVCLACNRLRSSIDIPAQRQGKVGKGKDAYYIADGLSSSFRKYLNSLLKANGFSHQLKNG